MGRQAVIALGIIAVLIAILFFATQLSRLRPARADDENYQSTVLKSGAAAQRSTPF
jgi:hypothetical protein